MKKFLFAATAAVAAMTVAPAANAAITVNCPGASSTASCTFDSNVGTGYYGDSLPGAMSFDDMFEITVPNTHAMYLLSITLTNTVNVGGPITFGLHELVDSGMVKLGDIAGGAVANDFVVLPGVYTLHFTGSTSGKASYSGTIDIAAIPEPASWAMMIAGIAAVGTAMRRRSQTTRVAFS